MKIDREWVFIMLGVACGTFLGSALYPRLTKKTVPAIADARVDRIKSLIEEADLLLRKSKSRN